MRIATALLAVSFAGSSLATLPPPTEEAKAQAALTAAKTAWTDKVAQYKLCLAMDRTAARYRGSLPSAKDVPPPVSTPACADPGPYVPPIAAAPPPLEAAGAHSPPATAVAPPSTNSTAAELKGGPKK